MTTADIDLTLVDRADVYKGGELAAHLERTEDGIAFRYTTDWIRNAGPPVASTLPVAADAVVAPAGAVPPFFAGLLPEGRRLSALRRHLKTSADDELSMVLAVGADVIGDVQVVPGGAPLAMPAPRLEVTSFSAVRFADLLAELDIVVDRIGLPGVQDKVSLAMLNVPAAAASGKHLLKLNPPEYRHLVENEHFFLTRAALSGVEAASADLVHDVDGQAGLAVQRFDRVTSSGGETAFAVEDGCQALGKHPEAKYRLTTESVLSRLCSLCDAPVPAAQTFLRQLVYAYLTGNGDAHAKNFSVLADRPGRYAPSPAYDLPSSQPYGDSTMALSLAGSRDSNLPGRRFVTLGATLGLPEKAAIRVVRETASSAERWLDDLSEIPFDIGVINKLKRVIRRRQSLLLNDQ